MVHAPAMGANGSAEHGVADGGPSQHHAAHERSSRMGGVNGGPSLPSVTSGSKPLSGMKAWPLNMAFVERRSVPRKSHEPIKPPRLFGLEEAPTFRPTTAEFQNPIEYINKLAEHGRKYGILKIIPPDDWNPDFAIDTERFHFRTRRQELNIVEGGTRANLNYLDQLAKFHKQRSGTNLNRFPSVDKRPLDLYKLKNLVEMQGGFDRVCKGKKWAEIGRHLGYSGKIMSSLSTSLKNSYQKWLLPFEEYLAQVKPGVRQQQEFENGGPYTPSSTRSPTKAQQHTPATSSNSPAVRASAALNHSVNDAPPNAKAPKLQIESSLASPLQPAMMSRPASGFTAVNSGFTAVNGGFTAVNASLKAAAAPPAVTTGQHVDGDTTSIPASPPQQRRVADVAIKMDADAPKRHNDRNELPVEIYDPTSLKRQAPRDDDMETDTAAGRRSKRVKHEGAPTVSGSYMTQPRVAAARRPPSQDRGHEASGNKCEHCGNLEAASALAFCDGCDHAYHPDCLEPPLASLPVGDWYCPRCLVGNGEYGFEEGATYSLQTFQTRAQKFMNEHFADQIRYDGMGRVTKELTGEHIEAEFWRLTESLTKTVEVEYGADIHSHISGSGFPTLEKNPGDHYASDPWNLNNLPLDKDSLFRHIKTDISGMTVPWLYVGMCFSCFCWHAEDHNTYSANYQHFGATKTWYGVPADDADKLEAAMREAVPELFEANPDLLFQLTTLLTPERLRRAGVRVYALDQQAGQFVITFPQAYHAGFNHGFNFNEAVNFAPSDWEPYGEEAIRRLRMFRRQPVFCHEELLLSAAVRDHTIKTAQWLGPALERMLGEEKRYRAEFLALHAAHVNHTCSLDLQSATSKVACELAVQPYPEEELVEDDQICAFCKAYAYLSRYICKASGTVLCLEHAGSYECCPATVENRCSGTGGSHVLQLRYNEDDLSRIVEKTTDTAKAPEHWTAKLEKVLDEGPSPSLKSLKTLLADGERINSQWDLTGLVDLRQFVDRCTEWVEEATNYTTRKQQNRRKNERAWRKSSVTKAGEQEERDRDSRNVENITRLLKSAELIGFDCPEIETLREKDEAISEYRNRVREMIKAQSSVSRIPSSELEELIEVGKSFNVDMPEVETLEKMIKQGQWLTSAKERHLSGKLGTLQELSDFIALGIEVGINETNPFVMSFREKKNLGQFWESKAKEIMEAENVHYQQLAALSTQASDLPVSPVTLARVEAILKKQREAQEQIVTLFEMSKAQYFRQRPTYKQVKEAMETLNDLTGRPHGTLDLEREQKRHEDWMRRGKKLFGKANAPLHILLQHMSYVEARNEACFDLTDTPRMPVEPSSREHTPAPQGDEGPEVSATSTRDVFCICRKPEAGMMIECNLCHEWYHGKCLKIARGKVKEEDTYTCPICDYRVKIPRDAARPRLEDLLAWQAELEDLPFQPEEEDCLNNIVTQASDFRQAISPLINNICSTPDDLQQQRFYLRKIEGADVLLVEETNFLRAELHKWAPVAPTPPPMTRHSLSTRKPRPTKQQKIMKELGIDNPDDLPVQFKAKKTVARKNSESQLKDHDPRDGGSPSLNGDAQISRAAPAMHSANAGSDQISREARPAGADPLQRTAAASSFFASPSASASWNHSDNDMFAQQPRNGLAAASETHLDPALFDSAPSDGKLGGHNRALSGTGQSQDFGSQGFTGPADAINPNSNDAEMFAQSLASEALVLSNTDFAENGGDQAKQDGSNNDDDLIDDFLA